jgi:hypothetical protein
MNFVWCCTIAKTLCSLRLFSLLLARSRPLQRTHQSIGYLWDMRWRACLSSDNGRIRWSVPGYCIIYPLDLPIHEFHELSLFAKSKVSNDKYMANQADVVVQKDGQLANKTFSWFETEKSSLVKIKQQWLCPVTNTNCLRDNGFQSATWTTSSRI